MCALPPLPPHMRACSPPHTKVLLEIVSEHMIESVPHPSPPMQALLEIVSELRSAGRPVVVVLSEQLVRQPEATLRAACLALSLPFEPVMLSWQAGPKPYDGVWAPWWYGSTHGATGE